MADTIRDYLVSLGFNIDGAGQAKFENTLKAVAANVVKLGVVVETTALAVVGFTTSVANGLDKLYWASQRTGATVQGIKSIGYAVSQVGGSADAARSSLEGLARYVRNNPGAESFLNRLGVQTRDASGNMRDMSAIFTGVGQKLSSMPYYRANQYASMFGIDENTLMAMRRGVGGFSGQYSAMAKAIGFNADQAAASSNRFMTSMRSFGEMASMARDKIGSNLAGGLAGSLDKLRRQILDNFPRIEQTLTKAIKGILWLGEVIGRLFFRVIEGAGDLMKWWDNLDRSSKQLIAIFGALTLALKVLNSTFWMSPIGLVTALAAAIALLWEDYKTWKEGGNSLIDWAKWEPTIDQLKKSILWLRDKFLDLKDGVGGWKSVLTMFAGYVSGTWVDTILSAFGKVSKFPMPPWLKGWAAYAAYLYGDRENIADSATSSWNYTKRNIGDALRWLGIDTDLGRPAGTVMGNNIQSDIPGGEGTLADRNNNPGNIRPAGGGGFRFFESALHGWTAMKNQLMRYFTGKTTGRTLQTVRDIVSTWAPAGDNNDPGLYAKQVAGWMGISPDAVLNLSNPSTMASLMQSMARKEGYSDWNSPLAHQAAGNTGIQQQNTYNIYGGNAREIGDEIEQRQHSSNARIMRTNQSGVR